MRYYLLAAPVAHLMFCATAMGQGLSEAKATSSTPSALSGAKSVANAGPVASIGTTSNASTTPVSASSAGAASSTALSAPTVASEPARFASASAQPVPSSANRDLAASALAQSAPIRTVGNYEVPPMTLGSDHARVVRLYGVGYMGFTNIPLGALSDLALSEPAEGSGRFARAPVIGVRYWVSSRVGVDAGFGFSTGLGTQKAKNASGSSSSKDALMPDGFALHVGAPVALATGNHYVFELLPELNVGHAAVSIPNDSLGSKVVHSGIHLDAGFRAGAEIHLGFIGVPELSLMGSVGVRLDVNYLKTEDQNPHSSVTDTRVIFRSTVGNAPWDLLTGGVSAFYYL